MTLTIDEIFNLTNEYFQNTPEFAQKGHPYHYEEKCGVLMAVIFRIVMRHPEIEADVKEFLTRTNASNKLQER